VVLGPSFGLWVGLEDFAGAHGANPGRQTQGEGKVNSIHSRKVSRIRAPNRVLTDIPV